jgi:hypothetical protein
MKASRTVEMFDTYFHQNSITFMSSVVGRLEITLACYNLRDDLFEPVKR